MRCIVFVFNNEFECCFSKRMGNKFTHIVSFLQFQSGSYLYLVIVYFQNPRIFNVPVGAIIDVVSEIICIFNMQKKVVDTSNITNSVRCGLYIKFR